MSTINVNTSVLSSMAPPRARLVSSQPTTDAPGDAVQLSGARASEEKPSEGVSMTTRVVAGVGLVLALGGAAAACTGGLAPAVPAPPAITEVQAKGLTAISPEAQSLMKDIASPSLTDNLTANQVRNRYGNEVDDVLAQAQSFEEVHARLSQINEKLASYAEKCPDGCTMVDNGAQIGVEKADGRLTVTSQLPDSSLQQSVTSRHGTSVKERDAEGHTTQMEETARYVKVTEDGVSKTVYRQTGKFEVTSQQGPRTQVKVTVDGASIKEEVRETISGFAGMIHINTTTKYDVPETSIMVYPRVIVSESKTRTSDDGFGAPSSSTTRTEVYDNGATKTFQKGADGKEILINQDGPAILIAGG